jgi:hypothetical protein
VPLSERPPLIPPFGVTDWRQWSSLPYELTQNDSFCQPDECKVRTGTGQDWNQYTLPERGEGEDFWDLKINDVVGKIAGEVLEADVVS